MKNLIVLTVFVLSTSFAIAQDLRVTEIPMTKAEKLKYLQETTGGAGPGGIAGGDPGGAGGGTTPEPSPFPVPTDRIEQADRIITAAKDVVALGEAIYELVKKGKPQNVTEYAPVSVVPKEPGTKEPVDMFDLENFSMPVQKKFRANLDFKGKDAVVFDFVVMYSYGGSYNGVGKYITGANIIPVRVENKRKDFHASMKVTGLMNHGTKADPVAGLMLTIKYKVDSWRTAKERNQSFHITGRGEFKSYDL